MVQLVLTFCLLADAGSCVERRPVLDEVHGPAACLTAAQPVAAEFVRGHPAYRLAAWRCELGRRPAERAA